MALIVCAVLVIFAIALAIVGVVAVGMEGRYSDRAPQLADRMRRVGRHLNGDAEPPAPLTRAIDQVASRRGRGETVAKREKQPVG